MPSFIAIKQRSTEERHSNGSEKNPPNSHQQNRRLTGLDPRRSEQFKDTHDFNRCKSRTPHHLHGKSRTPKFSAAPTASEQQRHAVDLQATSALARSARSGSGPYFNCVLIYSLIYFLVRRVTGEEVGAGQIAIPGAHHIAGQVGTADVEPVIGAADLVDARVGGIVLYAVATVPGGDGVECFLIGIGLVQARVAAGALGIPGMQQWVSTEVYADK